ncbi:hypothetical protein [Nocardioides convexus]|uniref:hypothetical protein n=1 Tax=Nocardioides convexus TaxID=2712224 RepID=UPI0024184B2A|nr:hypothetical protein [Nocardioides convexus]
MTCTSGTFAVEEPAPPRVRPRPGAAPRRAHRHLRLRPARPRARRPGSPTSLTRSATAP